MNSGKIRSQELVEGMLFLQITHVVTDMTARKCYTVFFRYTQQHTIHYYQLQKGDYVAILDTVYNSRKLIIEDNLVQEKVINQFLDMRFDDLKKRYYISSIPTGRLLTPQILLYSAYKNRIAAIITANI